MNITLYRIEKDGRGPYQNGEIYSDFREKCPYDEYRHPVPGKDSALVAACPPDFFTSYGSFEAQDFVFGFSNMAQLKSWFYDDQILKFLKQNGFKLRMYSGEIYAGNSQAIIRKDTSFLIEEKELI